MFAEVLNHVVTFRFTVDQHIQLQPLLFENRLLNVLRDTGAIMVAVEPALFKVEAQAANFSGLRKRADGGGRPGWQIETLTLQDRPHRISALAFAVLWGNGLQTLAHRRTMHAEGVSAGVYRCAPGFQSRRIVFVECLTQQRELGTFLQRKGEPAFDFIIQTGLDAQVDRAMQQRAGGADPHLFTRSGQRL